MKEEYAFVSIDPESREIYVRKEIYKDDEIDFARNEYMELINIANNLHFNIVELVNEKNDLENGRSIIKKR